MWFWIGLLSGVFLSAAVVYFWAYPKYTSALELVSSTANANVKLMNDIGLLEKKITVLETQAGTKRNHILAIHHAIWGPVGLSHAVANDLFNALWRSCGLEEKGYPPSP